MIEFGYFWLMIGPPFFVAGGLLTFIGCVIAKVYL